MVLPPLRIWSLYGPQATDKEGLNAALLHNVAPCNAKGPILCPVCKALHAVAGFRHGPMICHGLMLCIQALVWGLRTKNLDLTIKK